MCIRDRFGAFIDENIKLEPVLLSEDMDIDKLLMYYMGKNTPERQKFIIENLKIEVDEATEAQVKNDKKSTVSEEEAVLAE